MSADPTLAVEPVDLASARQRLASDPTLSAFVSANAGSGKTKVLVDRVLRLLLAGTPAGRILCLTYTKAAAAHMAVKVFDRLAGWVTATDTDLASELRKLEGHSPTPQRLVAARRLFAQAVETPGGLKIETIHAFCERLLHLVPFEANVPARFEVLDEAAAEEILADAKRSVLSEAASRLDPAAAQALRVVSLAIAADKFDGIIRQALAERRFLTEGLREPGSLAAAMQALAQMLGLEPHEDRASTERAILDDGLAPEEWPAIADLLIRGQNPDQERGLALRAAISALDDGERLDHYLDIFFTKEGWPRSDRMVTGAIAADLAERLRAERDRLIDLVDRRWAAITVERTAALLTLAGAIHARVAAIKHARGALDFDDLIDKTRTLLMRSDASSWVLHKLDAGIDHVLVDEAQDTNPAQWDILHALTAEFTAGEGARTLPRTVFAVGDPKQSIYGFQGADPRAFADSERHFRRLSDSVDARFERVELAVSFRSAPAVLAAVDMVFGIASHFAGLAFGEGKDTKPGTVHATSRLGHYGRVEIWQPVESEEDVEPDAWAQPVDAPEPTSPAVILAGRIAQATAQLVRQGDDTGRRVPPGEVLILVRKRGTLFEAIIRALKGAGLPVAGADRLRLGEHIAALDLIAVGRAALLPEDDLTLATALKSPLGDLTDDDLIEIGARRERHVSFHAAMATAASRSERIKAALATVEQWQELAERHGPFGFYATLLGPLGGRRALISRLGAEAGDAIDEFLSLAFAHEQRETPSLTLFLSRFGDAAHDVQRELDAGRGEIRVMTVHGAKGLEADTVILADACRYDAHRSDVLGIDVPFGAEPLRIPVWLPASKQRPQALDEHCADAREREREEHNRLLYVAMTRARDRLIIAPHQTMGSTTLPAGCWYGMIDAALTQTDNLQQVTVRELDAPLTGAMRVLTSGSPAAAEVRPAPHTPHEPPPLWLTTPVRAEPMLAEALRPSSALEDAGVSRHPTPSAGADQRRAGVLLHALLERLAALPLAERAAAAERTLIVQAADWAAADRDRLTNAALAILAEPRLKPLFGPASRAEVPIAGRLSLPGPHGGEVEVSGQIDRLALTPKAAFIADFKSGGLPASGVAETHTGQVALYAALVERAVPDRPVHTFVIYADGPSIAEVTAAQRTAALVRLAKAKAPN